MPLRRKISIAILIICSLAFVFVNMNGSVNYVRAQQPTGSVPTVTGTPKGPMASVKVGLTEDHVNVRTGPSTLYDAVGLIYIGASVPVLGKSIGGDWLLVEYPGVPGGTGWVWSLYMDVTPGEIPIVEMPPSPEPKATYTIDPTMASQFITTPLATRLPTFTPAPALVIATYASNTPQQFAGVPIGFIIIILLGLGILISLFTYFQSR
jgi:hypothetical protein